MIKLFAWAFLVGLCQGLLVVFQYLRDDLQAVAYAEEG
jgi:hypothetical protein